MKLFLGLLLGLASSAVLASEPEQRTLSLEERVKAQAAIERVYYSHQTGSTLSFEQVVPRGVLEGKVRKYLDQTAALQVYWKTAVTDEMLQRELERMATGTKLSGRLLELFAALGNDPFLIKECLARPTLVDRVARNFYAFDPSRHVDSRNQAESLHRRLVSGEISASAKHPNRTVSDLIVDDSDTRLSKTDTPGKLRLTREEFQKRRGELPARVGRFSDVTETAEGFVFNAVVSESPTGLSVSTWVIPKVSWDAWWMEARLEVTGEPLAAVAAGSTALPTIDAATAPCLADDTWDNGSLAQANSTDPRRDHTAVWTGTVMIIWGGAVSTTELNTGGMYDPATDSWTPTTTAGAPSARAGHTAIWTGSRMVIWGGRDIGNNDLDNGGRYDPTTDSWTPTSLAGQPAARVAHSAVWTGTLMVVWGGVRLGFDDLNSGGRYNPLTDSWMPTSVAGAPTGRQFHTAVWTGGRMVVWGGNLFNNGGRYDPVADSWAPVSVNGAPAGRWHHSAVWTGNRMLVWGGATGISPATIVTNTGGNYDPATDTWTSTSTVNAPSRRTDHRVIWAGSRMVVWGGWDGLSSYFDSGGRYDPATNVWTPTSTAGAPIGRTFSSSVWTGSLMVVWGGMNNHNEAAGGGRYDPVTDAWTPVATPGRPSPRRYHTAIWTGSLMTIWGGFDNYSPWLGNGARYDPVTDNWTPTSMIGAPSARYGHTAVWTGSRMVIYGGYPDYINATTTGGRYDPVADVWASMSSIGEPPGRYFHSAVWTGSRMLVWGGYVNGQGDTGGTYNPATDIWVPMSTIGAPTARNGHTAVWTGSHMLVWGGEDPNFNMLGTGGRYDLSGDGWTPISVIGALSARENHTAIWTGNRMLVWGGDTGSTALGSGGRYDPATNAWTPISTAAAPTARSRHSAVWTGNVMVVWGGVENGGFVGTGGRYQLATDSWLPTSVSNAPPGRADHIAVWTGSLMLLWGGFNNSNSAGSGGRYVLGASVDDDGDGLSECQGDCNDAHPSIYPGAPQVCDGYNNDCNDPSWPVVPANDADADYDGFRSCLDDCDDIDAHVYPGASQLCDGKNNNCDDPAWPSVPANEADADHDGYRICGGDCDDTRVVVHPGATETCNAVDDNCDQVVDNGGNGLCDDANPCTDDSCNGAFGCVRTDNSSACDDGNACTTADICVGGACLPGAGSLSCDDGNVCTTDSCSPATGCVFTNNAIACDDGHACTVGDVCGAGSCQGPPIVCNDNNPCTDDACDPPTGGCVSLIDDTNACSDGNLCTQTDTCQAGSCLGSNPVQCTGGCPSGFTQVGGQCQKTYDIDASLLDNLSVFCDGTGTNRFNNCGFLTYGFHWTDVGGGLAAVTRIDVQLEAGLDCGGATSSLKLNGATVGSFSRVGTCSCSSVHATASLPNIATGTYLLAGVNAISVTPSGECEGLSKSTNLGNNFARVTVTYLPHSSACKVGMCDSMAGACAYSNRPDGMTCSDDSLCTSGDACVGGACVGSSVSCNDGNLCTTDSCNPSSGCVSTNNTIGCDDGDDCTVGDACGGGACQSGAPAPPPAEVKNVVAAADKSGFSWSAAAGAIRYDVVRGGTASFPVGSNGAEESCFGDLGGTLLVDAALPAPGTGYWYLPRGESACAVGTFGTQSNGLPRVTTICP